MTVGRRVVLVFLDGVGIGPAEPDHNPFLRARLPWMREALGGVPTLAAPRLSGPSARAFPLDANLGVDGTPQSGTGQTSLLTGLNAARMFGRHFGPWTPVALRPVLARENLLGRALSAGLAATFANAYPRGWPGSVSTRRQAAPPLAARASGLLTRHAEHLARGEAVSSEIVNGPWRAHLGPPDLPTVSPGEAGANLARIAAGHTLTLYAHYGTDHAGHRGGIRGSVRALERVDAFFRGISDALDGRTTVLVASDHGNLEDARTGHTRNPVLGLAFGADPAGVARGLESILNVAGALLAWVGADGAPTEPGRSEEGPEASEAATGAPDDHSRASEGRPAASEEHPETH